MKKIFLTALAATALLTGCNRDEVVETNPQNAISFDNDFVENTTRSIVTKENLNQFYVHGIRNDGQNIMTVFDNVLVSKDARTGKFEYQDKRYWFDGDYEFIALNQDNTGLTEDDYSLSFTPGADGHLTNATLEWKNIGFNWGANADFDLVCASAKRTVSGNASVGTETVQLTFNHLLTGIAYQITNSLGNAYDLKVTALGFFDAKKGTYTFEDQNWVTNRAHPSDRDAVTFTNGISIPGNAGSAGTQENVYQSEVRFIFPTDKNRNAVLEPFIYIDVMEDGQVAKTLEIRKSIVPQDKLAAGQKYLVIVDITPETLKTNTIEFDVVKVEDFTDGGSVTVTNK